MVFFKDSRAHIRFKRRPVPLNKDLGAGDTLLQATRRTPTRLKGDAGTNQSQVDCGQPHDRERWDPGLIYCGRTLKCFASTAAQLSQPFKDEKGPWLREMKIENEVLKVQARKFFT